MFSPAALSASASNRPASTASRYVGCSTAPVRAKAFPKHASSDHDPLFRFHRWLANLRVLEIEEIKSVPYAPVSHPFVERPIGTIRREYLDRVLFWNAVDLRASWANSGITTTGIGSIARSMAQRPRNAPAHPPPLLPRLIVTLGSSIAAAVSRPRLLLDWEFATHKSGYIATRSGKARDYPARHRVTHPAITIGI